jgi:asparagine synthase (glutamine-hydrolysing)
LDRDVEEHVLSGLAGLFHRDRRPGAAPIVQRMAGAAPYRCVGEARSWSEGAVAFASDVADPESVGLPVRAIAFDGRLDNRDEIADALHLDRAVALRADAALVLAAYEVWGEDCARRLLGDFAFAVWDGRSRTVHCARDVMGVKPFYYHVTGASFAFASELRQVLACGLVAAEPNEAMVAEYLSASIQSKDETLYRGIMRLPPAHTMTVGETRVTLRRYWQLDPAADVVCEGDDEYAERFAELFRDAVACRVTGGRPAFFLSGGLDSSTVVAAASGIGVPIESFSMIFPGQPSLDESRYIADVVASSVATPNQVVSPRPDHATIRDNIARRLTVGDLPCDPVGESLLASMRARGARVALTGHGGDHAFAGSIYHYADLLRERDYVGFVRQLWADATTPDNGWSIWDPLLCGIRPLIPQPIRTAVRPLAQRMKLVPGRPDWISSGLASRVALDDRLRPSGDDEAAPTFGRQTACENYGSGWLYLVNEMTDCRAAEYGLDERHPFLDRRVVEFAVGIPESQRWRGRQTKYVLRRAMTTLPASVRGRLDKADFTPCVVQAFDALGGPAAHRTLRIAHEGWVSQARVDRLCDRAQALRRREDDRLAGALLNLWMIACIETWYCLVFAKGFQDGRDEQLFGGRRPAALATEEAAVPAA